jgi:hypothetical protein
VDRFFLQLMRVPGALSRRLICLRQLFELPEQLERMAEVAVAKSRAAEALQESEPFRFLLSVVRAGFPAPRMSVRQYITMQLATGHRCWRSATS